MNEVRITMRDFVSNRDTFIVLQCKDKNVLHIGPVDWPYTKEKLASGQLLYEKIDAVCKQQIGIDLDREGAEFLNNSQRFKKSSILVKDMNEAHSIDFDADVIVFGETLEHLMNLEIAAENLKRCMSERTKLIISVPNAIYSNHFLFALFGKEVQHPDHSVSWSYKTLTQFLKKCNLQIDGFFFTFLPEQSTNWKGKLNYYGTYFLAKIFPMLSSTLLVVCTKPNRPGA